MKKALAMISLLFLLSCLMTACAEDSSDDNSDDNNDSDSTSPDTTGDSSSDTGSDQSDDTASDSATTTTPNDLGIGSSCACTASTCETLGVPIPGAEGITGCEDVPADHAGKLVCLRTYSGSQATNTWFANGYCALQSIGNCEGSTGADLICSSATIGNYDAMTTCPAGTVLLAKKVTASALNGALTATMDSKTCVRACTTDADCRAEETDPVLGEASQYACIDGGSAKFCYDPRNIGTDAYTATAF